ncbi:MAG TPA: PAS domain S-box protein [Pyrinomonadaceae bacterium]|nr:PAS domain S-box protein [Pyrinomonadaceae bacterium]
MSKTLRILFLEDTPEDAELAVATLEDAGYTCVWERVQTREDFLDRLVFPKYDLVISDYKLPSLDGLTAVKLFTELGLDIPFILISGSLGEEAAIDSLKAGAADFVLKNKLFRLPFVIDRALKESEEHRSNRIAEQQIRLQARALESAANAIVITDRTGTITWVNPAFTKLTGYTEVEALGKNPSILRSGEQDDVFYKDLWTAILAGKVWHGEMVNVRKDGSLYHEEQTITPVVNEAGTIVNFIAIKQDISARKGAEKEVKLPTALLRVGLIALAIFILTEIIEGYLQPVVGERIATVFPIIVSSLTAVGLTYFALKRQRSLYRRTLEEIAERERAEQARSELNSQLEIERSRLKNIVTNVPGVVWEAGGEPDAANQQTDFVSDYVETMLGYSVEEWLSTPNFWLSLVHPDDRERAVSETTAIFAGASSKPIEFRWMAKDGHSIWVEVHAAVIRDENGSPVGMRGVTIDISERKRAEAELRFRNLILSTQQNTTIDGILVVADDGRIVSYNNRFVELWNIPSGLVEDGVDEPVLEHVRNQVADPVGFLDRVKYLYDHKEEISRDEIVLSDGSILERYSAPMIGPEKKYYGRVWYFRDVTENKLAANRIARSEAQLAEAQSISHIGSWDWDLHEGTLVWSDEHYRIFGLRPGEIDPRYEEAVAVYLHEADRDLTKKTIQHSRETLEPFDFHYRVVHGDDSVHTIHSRGYVDADKKGNAVRMYGTAQDVTDRQKAEAAVKEAEEKYRSIFENAVEGIFQSTSEGKFISVNPAMVRILGYESPRDLIDGRLDIGSQHYVDPKSRKELELLLAKDDIAMAYECEVYRKDGSKIWTQENIRAVRGDSGKLLHYEGSIEDITERKSLEEQFRQSQKMEAIGVLAGGIAHDFNNLLTAINGYSDLTLRKMQADDPMRHNITEIREAGSRAAALTSQLLTFSRKQVLSPKVHNLNSVIIEIDKMLRRLIRESIELRLVLDPKLGNIKADPGQIEQVIVNLAVNARDAMLDGGTLTIETENVELGDDYVGAHITALPGRYVRMTVTDTGEGMDEAVQHRIFEPFFTTKALGKGTGLGLSTVHGIVEQSSGSIRVYSEVGHGTTFKIYIPRVDETVEGTPWIEDRQEDLTGTETILMVEDDEIVRQLVLEILTGSGYYVLEADSGNAALSICQTYTEPIHLLLTDVIMPGISGPAVKDEIVKLLPDIKVLFMSGYTDDSIASKGILDSGTAFIEKPFSPDALGRKIREILTS